MGADAATPEMIDAEKPASIYGLCDRETGEIRYIGKAVDPEKRLAGHMRECRRRNTPLYAWLRKHGEPKMVIIEAGCSDWRVSERRHIAWARASGLRLLNVADGGDEPHCPVETRRANAAAAVAKRPKYVMRAYRTMEANIRSLARHGSHEAAERGRRKLDLIKMAIDMARSEGRLQQVDRRIGEFLNGRAGQANRLPA